MAPFCPGLLFAHAFYVCLIATHYRANPYLAACCNLHYYPKGKFTGRIKMGVNRKNQHKLSCVG